MGRDGPCAACGVAGALFPYPDVARASGWPHEFAHLECARYMVRSVKAGACDSPTCWCAGLPSVRVIQSTGQRYTVSELPSTDPMVRVFSYRYLTLETA